MCDTTYVLQQDADNLRWPMLDTHPNRQCESEFGVLSEFCSILALICAAYKIQHQHDEREVYFWSLGKY